MTFTNFEVHVIPLKLFYCQTFFLKLGAINLNDMNIKTRNKKMGSPCLFTHQWVLKIGYFYRLHVKNSNHLHTELSLGHLEDAKFYLESKASFSDISTIALFKLFLIAWLQEYCTFSDSSVISLKSSHGPIYTQLGTIFQEKQCSTIKLFYFFKYALYQTALSKYLKNKLGVTVLV